jgi:hypothetical protein
MALKEVMVRELRVINDNRERRINKLLESESNTRRIIKEEAEGNRYIISNNQMTIINEISQTK